MQIVISLILSKTQRNASEYINEMRKRKQKKIEVHKTERLCCLNTNDITDLYTPRALRGHEREIIQVFPVRDAPPPGVMDEICFFAFRTRDIKGDWI